MGTGPPPVAFRTMGRRVEVLCRAAPLSHVGGQGASDPSRTEFERTFYFPHRESDVTTSAPFPWIQADVPALVLAPMEGVADVAMRALLSERGGFTFCVAEFLRISQAVPGTRAFQTHVPELMHGGTTPAGLPVQVQLLGGNPSLLAQAALVSIRAGALAVDLDFGCPARTVNRHDGGATLLQYPDRIREIVAAVRAAVPADLPVSTNVWIVALVGDANQLVAKAEFADDFGCARE